MLLALLLALGSGRAWSGEPTIVTLRDFKFENGSVLPELHIAYETPGKTVAGGRQRDRRAGGRRGGRERAVPLIGPGKTIDTDKYFVITVDAIGGGDSSSPADGAGQEFPRYTIRDMMEAAARAGHRAGSS